LFIGICSLLLLSSNVVLAACKWTDKEFSYATTDFSFSNVTGNMAMVYILCMVVTGMIFGNEHTNHTMKNSVSYGIPRGTIYFGKLLVQIAYSIIAVAIIVGVHIASGYLLLENSGVKDLNLLLRACTACIPLFIFGLAVTNCFVFNIEGFGAIAASSGIMIALPLVCNLLGMKFNLFRKFAEILPWNMITSGGYNEATKTIVSYWTAGDGYRNCWIYGLIQVLVVAVLGYMAFRKKEIK
jgi:ABC-type transport system involved in multi-copper enzyme maturation permease subunit